MTTRILKIWTTRKAAYKAQSVARGMGLHADVDARADARSLNGMGRDAAVTAFGEGSGYLDRLVVLTVEGYTQEQWPAIRAALAV